MKAQDFVQSIFETRSGDPHPTTGIPPTLMTLKWTQTGLKPIKVLYGLLFCEGLLLK